MRKWIISYFNFTKSEFNGILALFALIVLFIILPKVYVLFWPEQHAEENVTKIEKLNLEQQFKIYEKRQKSNFSGKPGRADFSKLHKKSIKLRVFDPNTLNQQGWEELGLSPKQANAVLNYIGKGGKFFKAEDLKKMYTISPEVYLRLVPYVKIEQPARPVKSFAAQKYAPNLGAKKPTMVYELNSLDTIGLLAINGIGPAFARRIFKYRERLGGFHNPEQLMEVFGIDSAKYAGLIAQIRINVAVVKKININTAEFDGLKQHPYLSYKQISAIIQYRKQHGNYSSFADLKKVVILPAETVDKLAPYLSF
jgi:competence protein ComEA